MKLHTFQNSSFKTEQIGFLNHAGNSSLRFKRGEGSDIYTQVKKDGEGVVSDTLDNLWKRFQGSYYLQINPSNDWIVLDLDTKKLDDEKTRDAIFQTTTATLSSLGIKSFANVSRSGKGYHFWIPVGGEISQEIGVKFFNVVAKAVAFHHKISNSIIEVFPKGDNSFIVAPIGGDFETLHNQIKDIDGAIRANTTFIKRINTVMEETGAPKELFPYIVLYGTDFSKGVRNNIVNGMAGLMRKANLSKEKAIEIYNLMNYREIDAENRIPQINNSYSTQKVTGVGAFTDGGSTFYVGDLLANLFEKERSNSDKLEEGDVLIDKIVEVFMRRNPNVIAIGKQLYNWMDNRWVIQSEEDFTNLIVRVIKELAGTSKEITQRNIYAVKLALKELIRRPLLDMKVSNSLLDADKRMQEIFLQEIKYSGDLMFLKNGILDVRKDIFRPYNPTDYVFHRINTNYIPNIPSNILQDVRFYLRSAVKSQNDYETLMDVLALSLYRDKYKYAQHFYIFYGVGNNGKSALTDILGRVIGSKPLKNSLDFQQLTGEKFMIQQLAGCLLNITDELTNTLKSEAVNKLKTLTSGGEISADVKHSNSIEFSNSAGIVFSANEIPTTDDIGAAFNRRCVIIPFEKRFGEDNPENRKSGEVLFKLKSEEFYREAFLFILVERLKEILKRPYTPGKSVVLNASEELNAFKYERLSKPLKGFVADYYELTGNLADSVNLSEFRTHLVQTFQEEGKINPYVKDYKKMIIHLQELGCVISGLDDASIIKKLKRKTVGGPNGGLPIETVQDNIEDKKEIGELVEHYSKDDYLIDTNPSLSSSNYDIIEVRDDIISDELGGKEMGKILDFIKANDIIAVDTETYSYRNKKEDNVNPFVNSVRIITIGNEKECLIIDTHKFSNTEIETILANLVEKKLVFHNAKFDILSLYTSYKMELPKQVCDTLILSSLVNNANGNEDNSLKTAVSRFLGVELSKEEQKSDWSQPILTASQLQYAGNDVKYLIPLMKVLVKDVNSLGGLKAKTPHWSGVETFTGVNELNFLLNLIKITIVGVPVNKEELEDQLSKATELYARLRKEITEEYNIENPNSTQQVIKAFKSLGIELTSSKEEVLKEMNHPLAVSLLELRGALKKVGMIEGYIDTDESGRLHPNFNQNVSTGRMSCSLPNVQQIPQNLKKVFYKEEGGKALIKIDYPAIELRILASFLKENFGDDTMANVFNNPDADPHKVTASLIFNKTIEEVSADERQAAKAVNFGLSYGMGAAKFQQYAKGYKVRLTEEQAKEFKNKFIGAYKGLKEWHRWAVEATRQLDNGIISSIPVRTLGGRVLGAKGFTNSLNYSIQGTGGDITKYAINIFYKLVEDNNLLGEANIVNIVHDEIIVESNEDKKEQVEALLKRAMEISADYLLKYFKTTV